MNPPPPPIVVVALPPFAVVQVPATPLTISERSLSSLTIKYWTSLTIFVLILQVYIDGKLQAFSKGSGDALDDDWGYKAAVGSFDFDGRYIRGKMDDFYMYDYEISPGQIKKLLSIKCPQPKKKKLHHFQFWR